jgi:catechol 2,3-dioxygenase-like lactoylglutathione lyase family enzyme
MLSDHPIFPVLPAADLARAKAFYTETIGLSVQFESEAGVGFTAGNGTMLFVYPYGKTKAEHTVAGFLVSDVEAVVADLRAKGLTFEEYDMPGLKTVNGIAEAGGVKGAWFKDTEGNILSLGELPAS